MLTFFTTAKPFRGHTAVIQRNALQSWKLLDPDVEIIVLGNDEGAADVCAELGLRHEPEIAVNPSRNEAAGFRFWPGAADCVKNLLCYANCDIVFTKDFRVALDQLIGWRHLVPHGLGVGGTPMLALR